jgi:uncharacterized damage-inducible protein DinB
MRMVDPILAEFEQEAKTTRRLLERVPGDKMSWKPHPKSMSLGQLSLHIAQAPGYIANWAANTTYEMTGSFEQESAATTAQVVAAFDASLAKVTQLLSGFDDAAMMAMWSFVAGGKTMMTMPRIALIRSLILNHSYHHRGQLSVYLRELNVPVPPIYGPSADENPFAGA